MPRFFAVLRKERVFLMIASSALHAQERRPTRGERLALEGRCAIAMPELERELELVPAPESAHVAWRLGQCRIRARDYPRAAADLERALAIDPSLAEANLDLARARYHAGDLDGADAASTTDVFDYDQHVVGLVLNVSFARSR